MCRRLLRLALLFVSVLREDRRDGERGVKLKPAEPKPKFKLPMPVFEVVCEWMPFPSDVLLSPWMPFTLRKSPAPPVCPFSFAAPPGVTIKKSSGLKLWPDNFLENSLSERYIL